MNDLAGNNQQICRSKVASRREHGLSTKCSQRINRAVPEIELGAVSPALSETRERSDTSPRLRFVERHDLAAYLYNKIV